ncbi:MAG: MMPL family transporter, partial [Acidimicrobiales bacterium]|nr:MMPL family transporter [Acidimicrobiales bacterium]
MKRFWSNLAVQLGKRAGLVSVVGLIITLVLGLGIPKLQFATGQDSYLNKNDQVAKDNVAYQDLFGGQLMVVLFTMDEGHKVSELMEKGNRAKIEAAAAKIAGSPEVEAVLTPADTLNFSASLLSFSPETAAKIAKATASAATQGPVAYQKAFDDAVKALPADKQFEPLAAIGKLTLDAASEFDKKNATDPKATAEEKAAAKASIKVRESDLAATTERVGPFLLDAANNPRTLDNPEWVDVLLHDNEGKIRKPLRSSFFDDRHAQMIVRLVGNADIETEGQGAIAVKKAFEDVKLDGATTVVTGAPVLLKDINDYLRGGILSLGAIAIAIMVVILLVFFDVRWRLLPLAVIIVGVTWAFGLAGYLGIPLSVVTIAGLPVMLGVGIDYAIQ